MRPAAKRIDPRLQRRWGIVSARPSEFLVHVRSGTLRERSSGQGAWCFKWPGDSVALVPTSIQRLQFSADQVTLERVGVEVTGLAVFRVAEPLIAFRMLDFDDAGRAVELLSGILREMFVGACRRLVANLDLDAVMTQRKQALAGELMREIAPVVEGAGRVEDGTQRGWGVILDTIEIQNVRVLSQQVFDGMQAEFRAELDRRQQQARLGAEAEVERRRSEAEERARLARLARDGRLLEAEKALDRARHAEALAQSELSAERAQREADLRYEAEARARAAEAEAAAHARSLEQAQAELRVRRLEAELAVRNRVAPARVQEQLVERLPEIAGALAAQPIGELRVVQTGGSVSPVVDALASLWGMIAPPRGDEDNQKGL